MVTTVLPLYCSRDMHYPISAKAVVASRADGTKVHLFRTKTFLVKSTTSSIHTSSRRYINACTPGLNLVALLMYSYNSVQLWYKLSLFRFLNYLWNFKLLWCSGLFRQMKIDYFHWYCFTLQINHRGEVTFIDFNWTHLVHQ